MTKALAAGDLQLRRFDAGVDGHRGWSLSKWDSSDGDAQLSHCGIGASKAPASPTTSSIPARTPVIGKPERFTPKPCFSSLVFATERAQTGLVQATRRVLPQTHSQALTDRSVPHAVCSRCCADRPCGQARTQVHTQIPAWRRRPAHRVPARPDGHSPAPQDIASPTSRTRLLFPPPLTSSIKTQRSIHLPQRSHFLTAPKGAVSDQPCERRLYEPDHQRPPSRSYPRIA